MALYIIRGDTVTAYAAAPAKAPKDALNIRSAREIETSDLSAGDLCALWNALPGTKPVAKFKDRKTAARRLWTAFGKLALAPAKQPAPHEKPTAGTKQARVIAMLRRTGGATIDEIAGGTGWQFHAVRGMISDALKKKLGLDVVSSKENRGRVYRIIEATKRAA
jgi:hypothetical protein